LLPAGFHQALLRPHLCDVALTVFMESKWKLCAHRFLSNVQITLGTTDSALRFIGSISDLIDELALD
jgi:hypothetical protein